ncbi:MAG: hypothetical protein K2Z81_19440, partial [Cyanobacteria bacterium]|nr:hypothetical protein [Cyanobacteriota bacterium]
SISLSISEQLVTELTTIVVACCETESFPELANMEELQPVGFLRTAGGMLYKKNKVDGLLLLESLLSVASNVKHIMVCLHTGCSFVNEEEKEPRRLKLLRSANPTHELSADELALRPYEDELLRQMRAISGLLESVPRLKFSQPVLHGWLYESELEWTSFFDFETGLLLPLSAHTDLCNLAANRIGAM